MWITVMLMVNCRQRCGGKCCSDHQWTMTIHDPHPFRWPVTDSDQFLKQRLALGDLSAAKLSLRFLRSWSLLCHHEAETSIHIATSKNWVSHGEPGFWWILSSTWLFDPWLSHMVFSSIQHLHGCQQVFVHSSFIMATRGSQCPGWGKEPPGNCSVHLVVDFSEESTWKSPSKSFAHNLPVRKWR